MRLFGALLVLILLAGCSPKPAAPERDLPHIVLIVVDTLRRDHVSSYGSELATPNIAALAESGQVFTNVSASFHQTTMSMGALFTGRTPSVEGEDPTEALAWNSQNWCGMARFREGPDDSCVPERLPTLAESVRDQGYWTLGVVSNRLLANPSGYDQGFDRWIEVWSPNPDLPNAVLASQRTASHVYAAVTEAMTEIPDGPMFLYVHYIDVHDYRANDETYAEAVVRTDGEIGRLLELLEAKGLREDAVVFFTSDHGEILGEKHKGFQALRHLGNPSFQPVLEIPLIVSPARFEGTDRFLRSQDIGALIEQVAGIDAANRPDADLERTLERDELLVSERFFLSTLR